MTSRFDRTPAKTARAKRLRHEATQAERILWSKLRSGQAGVSFRRQHPIGPYVLDFHSAEAKLAIELDGDSHGHAAAITSDERRTTWLSQRGVRVLRFWNDDIHRHLDGVIDTISATIVERMPVPPDETSRPKIAPAIFGRGS